MIMRPAVVVAVGLMAVVGAAQAGVYLVNSDAPSGNAAALNAWLSQIGCPPEFLEDFETGFTVGQNLSGVAGLLPGELVIRDTGPGTPSAAVQSSSTWFGGSNPIGTYAVAHDEQAYLELDFSARPVDYVSLYDIDHTGMDVTITFVGGGTASTHLETTGGSGDSAEFFGAYRNDQPRMTRLQLDASGDGRWGIDNLRYGLVPEPATLALVALGGLGMLLRRRPK
jgi:hypothetical protein